MRQWSFRFAVALSVCLTFVIAFVCWYHAYVHCAGRPWIVWLRDMAQVDFTEYYLYGVRGPGWMLGMITLILPGIALIHRMRIDVPLRPFAIAVALSLWLTAVVLFAWVGHPAGLAASVDLNWSDAPGFGIPYWMLVAVMLIVPALGVRRRILWALRRVSSTCPRCGYDLRASVGRCPECGTPFFPAQSVPEPSCKVPRQSTPPPLQPLPKPRPNWQKDRAAILWRVRHAK